jgi:hypothetical protein
MKKKIIPFILLSHKVVLLLLPLPPFLPYTPTYPGVGGGKVEEQKAEKKKQILFYYKPTLCFRNV